MSVQNVQQLEALLASIAEQIEEATQEQQAADESFEAQFAELRLKGDQAGIRKLREAARKATDKVAELARERFLVEYRAKWPDGVSFTQEHYVATCVSEYVRL